MREEDKLILLSEIMGIDCSKFVSKYIEELRSSDSFIMLCENVSKARNVASFKAQQLIEDFQSIDFDSVTSIKECFILYAKIQYLLANSQSSDYLNPLVFNEDYHKITLLGEISISFDGKNYTLNDMILDERYTTAYKIDYVKELILNWHNEVLRSVVDPLEFVLVNIDSLPDYHYIDADLVIFSTSAVVTNVIFFLLPLLNSQFVRDLYTSQGVNLSQIFFDLFFISLMVFDIGIVIRLNYLRNKYGRFVVAKKTVQNSYKIRQNVADMSSDLYKYILNSLSSKRRLTKEISDFAIKRKYVTSITYLYNLLRARKEEIPSKDIRSFIVVIAMISMIVCAVLIIISYILYKTGVIS